MKFLFVALFAIVSRLCQFWSCLCLHDQEKAKGSSGVSGNTLLPPIASEAWVMCMKLYARSSR